MAEGTRSLVAPVAATVVAGVLLVVLAGVGLFVGSSFLSPSQVFDALRHVADEATTAVVLDMRLPRTLLAIVVGVALGAAGALMQGLTRNPLADPGLLGVNAGAGLAVVVAVALFGAGSFPQHLIAALLGALVVSIAVYTIGFSGKTTPAMLVLTGTAFSAVCLGLTNGFALIDPQRFNVLRGWSSGSVAGRELDVVQLVAVLIAVGVLLAAVIAHPLGQLALGEDLARSLGVNIQVVRVVAAAAITLLAGAATAAAGPIVFVGLMIPQLARAISGPRMGWVLTLSALGGAVLMLVADIAGRLVIWPVEAPAGVVTAVLGAPVLVMIARGRRVSA